MKRLKELEQRNPEWLPWLGVVGEVIAADGRDWESAVPRCVAPPHELAPLLAGSVLEVDGVAAARLLQKLIHLSGCGRRGLEEADAREAFRAALNRDDERLRARARSVELDPDRFRAVAALLPQPFLRACNRGLRGALPRGWSQGYCPLCGAWAALAEICGVERVRYLRCGECGSAWRVHGLSCTYCGLTNHDVLGSLVAQGAPAKATLEICGRCRGYLKAFNRLSPSAPEDVVLEDLASVELDLAALERGYRRPEGPGHRLDVTLA
jgi:FdhE protein